MHLPQNGPAGSRGGEPESSRTFIQSPSISAFYQAPSTHGNGPIAGIKPQRRDSSDAEEWLSWKSHPALRKQLNREDTLADSRANPG